MVARTERSPGSGRPLAFPVSQWRHERGDDARYSGGAAPDFHRLPSFPIRVELCFESTGADPPVQGHEPHGA